MSGNFADFQAAVMPIQNWWTQDSVPMSQPLQQWLEIAAGATTRSYSLEYYFTNIYPTWAVPDPQPYIPRFVPQGAGATTSVFKDKGTWFNTVLTSWIPPDPLPTIPIQFGKRFTKSAPPSPVPTSGGLVTPPHNVNTFGAIPVYVVPNTPSGSVVASSGVASAITQGGSPVAIVIGPCNGGLVINPTTTAGQGINSTENVNLDFVNPPLSGDGAASGTTFLLSSAAGGNTFNIPALGAGVTLWANAATSGHRLTVIVW